MPFTPLHVIPSATVYFLFFRRLNGLAFFFGSLLIDLEPVLYIFFRIDFPHFPLLLGGFARQGYHMITHNPFSIVLLVAPALLLLAKAVEHVSHGFVRGLFPNIQRIQYSWKATYLSALAGGLLHFALDLTMHEDINLGFPFVNILNPFIDLAATTLILYISLVMILPAYLIGRKINRGSPFSKLP